MLQFSRFAQEGAHPPPTPTPYSYIVNNGFPPKFRILDRTLLPAIEGTVGDRCASSQANVDIIEHDVSGPKLPPKPQPHVGEIKHLPANECEDN